MTLLVCCVGFLSSTLDLYLRAVTSDPQSGDGNSSDARAELAFDDSDTGPSNMGGNDLAAFDHGP